MTSEPMTPTTVEMALEMLYWASVIPRVAYDERLEQAHAVNENRVARGHDDKDGGHDEPTGEVFMLPGHTAPFKQTNSLRRGPVVPKIALKDKGIGLTAMPAGLKGKVGCYRWSAI